MDQTPGFWNHPNRVTLPVSIPLTQAKSMLDLYDKIQESLTFIKSKWDTAPKAGIILGTGLGPLVNNIDVQASIDYADIPNFPRSTAISHKGRLVCGTLDGLPVVAMEGRIHMYEGYPLKEITLPIRVMHAMGADLLVCSNAVGGLNPYYRKGDVMVIDDHINLMGDNPLIGVNDDRLGPRFPDMCEPYTQELIDRALKIARAEDITAHKGVLVAVAGPNLETRAEYRFLRTIGADVVGMSTIPEVVVAVHEGMRVVGFSVITDLCFPDALEPANVNEIIEVANNAEPKLTKLVMGVLAEEK